MRAIPVTSRGQITVGGGDTLLLPRNFVRITLLLRVGSFTNAFFIIGNPAFSNFAIRHAGFLPILNLKRIDFGPALGDEIWVRAPGAVVVSFLETSSDDVLDGYMGL